MKPRNILYPVIALCLISWPVAAQNSPLGDLLGKDGSLEEEIRNIGAQVPVVSTPEAMQELPANNNAPGYNWKKYTTPHVKFATVYEEVEEDADASAQTSSEQTPGATERSLSRSIPKANSRFGKKHTIRKPVQVVSSVTGGLPGNIAAFLDTIAYAEGTRNHYNYIFDFVLFYNYNDHPRRTICVARLCSNAAGRYQILSKTWDPIRAALRLKNFSPTNQDKAALELIRRAQAYNQVKNASDFKMFQSAMRKLNRIWASLPGSPYGQHTYSTAQLWAKFKQARRIYKS